MCYSTFFEEEMCFLENHSLQFFFAATPLKRDDCCDPRTEIKSTNPKKKKKRMKNDGEKKQRGIDKSKDIPTSTPTRRQTSSNSETGKREWICRQI